MKPNRPSDLGGGRLRAQRLPLYALPLHRQDHGRSGLRCEEPEVIDAIRCILAAHAAGIRAALHCSAAEHARRTKAWDFDMVTASNDVRLMAGAAAASVAAFRKDVALPTTPTGAQSY